VSELEILHSKSPAFYDIYERKTDLQHQTHYCPGCGHGIVHKLTAEAIVELGLQDRTVFVSPVGCSVFGYYYFDVGNVQAAHGRAPAVATAVRRALPEGIVISYQGDGDLAAIGTAEIIHAANRGENITVIFVNNAIYGMTGGQLAPTTPIGEMTTTSPFRRSWHEGPPIKVAELLAALEAPVYIERVALIDNKNVMRARRAIRKALELQRAGAGFSMVEVLSPCPTIWKKTPVEAQKWVREHMLPVFPLGVYRDRKPEPRPAYSFPQRTLPEVLEVGSRESAPVDSALRTPQSALSVKIAGFGGQGILLLGQILAEMGMTEGREVSWLPSYGPEMRSGSAYCDVNLSSTPIGSPLVSHPDVLIAMNELSLEKFGSDVPSEGLILYNGKEWPAGMAKPQARVIALPAADIADKLGSAKVGNIVMLGALLAATRCLATDSANRVLEHKVKDSRLLEMDRHALEAGLALAA